MTVERSPNEFCEAVRREHDELRSLLGDLHKILSQRLEEAHRVAALLASLVEHVEAHFREEEVDGFFDQVTERAPRLSHRVEALRREHESLLAAVRNVHEVATGNNGSPDWWQQLEEAFHQFSTQLMHHESAENELLKAAYEDDIGAGD